MRRIVDYEKRTQLYKEGYNDREIAKELQIHHTTIYQWRLQNKLPANTCNRLTENEHNAIRELYKEGLSDRQIGLKIKRPTSSIRQFRLQHNLEATHKAFKEADIPDTGIPTEDKPWRDPESLYCDTEFLEKIMEKPIRRIENANS